uniref:Uncharacterized protein n=1 Tax=Setaria italica TaxID=4555 RepID=K3YCJ7_SETIT
MGRWARAPTGLLRAHLRRRPLLPARARRPLVPFLAPALCGSSRGSSPRGAPVSRSRSSSSGASTSGCESRTGTARAWGRWNRAWGFLNRARGGFPWRQWWPEARRTPATQGRRGQKRHGKLRPGAVGLPAREERI